MVKRLTLMSLSLACLLSPQVKANDGVIDIWPSIPFVRGADLCKYKDAYGQTRTEYMRSMVENASELLQGGAKGDEALAMLVQFDKLYDKNQALATRYNLLDVTLESTLKAYLDGYYRQVGPMQKKVSFRHVNDIKQVVNAAKRGQRDGVLTDRLLKKLDYVAYGTYALAPTCRGDIQVTLHLIGRDGRSESFQAIGAPQNVMSGIASEMFSMFQSSQFPSTVRIGNRSITLLGALNGSIGMAPSPHFAAEACATLGGRLPNRTELELLSGLGDWNGGVSIGDRVWAMPGGRVYHPHLMNPSPVREPWEVNDKSFHYYCIQ